MARYTFVVEFPDGQEPGIGANTEILGGRLMAVQFSDALAELEEAREWIEGVRDRVKAIARKTERLSALIGAAPEDA